MVMQTDLATAVAASGLPVTAVAGWRGRTRPGGMATRPQTIVLHHTATSSKAPGDYPTLRIIRDGRSDLPGPLAQLGMGRSGRVYVVAAGRANHAGATHLQRQGNARAIGIEIESDGSPISDAQADAVVSLCAALCRHYGIPADHVESHAEIATPTGRKNDVRNNMSEIRRRVALAMHPAAAARVAAHDGVPASLDVDAKLGPATRRALEWYVDRPQDGAWDRDDVRAIESWSGRPRTGIVDRDDVRALQAKVGADVDGVWGDLTTQGLQSWLNRRIAEGAK